MKFSLWYKLSLLKPQKLPAILFERRIFTRESLGLNSFDSWCEERRKICGISKDELLTRIDPGTTNSLIDANLKIILTDDLKNFIAFSSDISSNETENALGQLKNLFTSYHRQAMRWNISSFPYGTVLMKLLYKLNAIDVAVEFLKNKELSAIFDQLSSYQLCMDLLFKAGRYEEVLSTWAYFLSDSVVEESMPYPRSLLILVYAAFYKINSKDSMNAALDLYKKVRHENLNLSRRALSFLTVLCLRQNEPEISYELLSTVNCDEFVLGRSLKIILCQKLQRLPEIAFLLQQVILSDVSADCWEDNRLSNDVLKILQNLAEETADEKLKTRFGVQLKLLRSGGHFVNASVDQLLKSPISLSGSSQSNLSDENRSIESLPVNFLPATDFSAENLKVLGYCNETKDLDDLNSFTRAEKRLRRKEKIVNSLVDKVAKDGPFQS